MNKLIKKLTLLLNKIEDFAGHPATFLSVFLLIAAWFIAGIPLQYGETWFQIMDIAVFLTTFLLVFIVLTSQNADTKAMQDKLDEIIKKFPELDSAKAGEEKRIKRGEKSK